MTPLIAFVLACVPHLPPDDPGWETSVRQEHPLVGVIWDVSSGATVPEEMLIAELSEARVVILGERHDNPDHHRLQARLVSRLATADHGIAFEMLDADDEVEGATTPRKLARQVGWRDSGWPDFALYEPVFTAAMERGAAVRAGLPSQASFDAVRTGGLDALPPAERADLGLDRPLEATLLADLEAELVESHCGHAPPGMLAALVDVQRLKDASMARSVRQGPALLVTGSGHARRDRGVPWFLGDDVHVVLLVEVLEDTDPAAYLEAEGPADTLWFTPRVDEVDPCEKFREALEAMGSER